MSLNVCQLLCNPYASLWPLPTGNITIQKDLLAVNTGSIAFFRLSSKSIFQISMKQSIAHFERALNTLQLPQI